MKIIKKPGIYRNLPYKDYDAIPAIRSSYLKKHIHCAASTQLKDADTASMRTGRAAHTFILEGEKEYKKRYEVMSQFSGDKRSKEYKLMKSIADMEAIAYNKEVLPHEEDQTIRSINKNVLAHPTAKLILKHVEPETVIVWKDKATGLLCKARFDIAPQRWGDLWVMADLKTCESASEYGFAGAIKKYGYAISAAFYLEGASIVSKKDIHTMLLIACEKEAPYKVEVHELTAGYIQKANDAVHTLLKKEKECRDRGQYPFYNCGGVIVQEGPKDIFVE